MKQCHATRIVGVFVASLALLFALTTVSEAAGKAATFKNLRKLGIATKLVRVDRVDGFKYGISFKGARIPSILLAPGADSTFLVDVDGNEMIFQGDGAGSLQVIQADGNLAYVLCILDSIITMMQGLITCEQGDPVCLLNEIVVLVTNLVACNASAGL